MQNDTIQSELVQSLEPEKVQEEPKETGRKISLKIVIIIAVIIAIGILTYIFKGVFIAATVDGSPISRLEIIQKLEKTSAKGLLDSLITEKLIKNEAKAKGISVSDSEVNDELKKIEDQVKAQGQKLDEALSAQGMTVDDLKERIAIQKDMEKLLADKANVTDEEVKKYMTDNKITPQKGQEEQTKSQIKEMLKGQKFNEEAQKLIDSLKAKAKIRYFVKY